MLRDEKPCTQNIPNLIDCSQKNSFFNDAFSSQSLVSSRFCDKETNGHTLHITEQNTENTTPSKKKAFDSFFLQSPKDSKRYNSSRSLDLFEVKSTAVNLPNLTDKDFAQQINKSLSSNTASSLFDSSSHLADSVEILNESRTKVDFLIENIINLDKINLMPSRNKTVSHNEDMPQREQRIFFTNLYKLIENFLSINEITQSGKPNGSSKQENLVENFRNASKCLMVGIHLYNYKEKKIDIHLHLQSHIDFTKINCYQTNK